MFVLASILNLMFALFVSNRVSIKNGDSFNMLKEQIADFVEFTEDPWIRGIMTCICSALSVFGGLVFSLSMLSVVTAWTQSMRDAGRPHYTMLDKVLFSAKVFKVLYVIVGIGQLVSIALGIFVTRMALLPLIVIDVTHIAGSLWTLVDTIWMLIDLGKPTSDSLRTKHNQLVRIIFLVLFQANVIFSFDSPYTRTASVVFWIIESCLLMWPKTLAHLETPPLVVYPTKDVYLENA